MALPSTATAEDALKGVRTSSAEPKFELRDCAIVSRNPQGGIDLAQSKEIAPGEGLVGLGTAGLVAGLLLGLPIGGALIGLAGGAVLGLRDTGIPDDRMRQLGEVLKPGEALLCLLVDADALELARQALGRYGAVVEVELASESDL